jgi:hypothetical membrane protein
MKRFRNLQTWFAGFLVLIPLILYIYTGEWRDSISDYAYSEGNLLYAALLSIAATIFMYSGFIKKKWYNVVLGIALLLVGTTKHNHEVILHYGAATVFFIGSVVVMIVYSSTKQRIYKIIAGAFIVLAMILHFAFDFWSLLIAEWIGILPISLHFIGESQEIID